MNIIKLHLNLIKVIINKIKSKDKVKEKMLFIVKLLKEYFIVIKNETVSLWKFITDKDFRKKLKQTKKFQQLRTDLKRGVQLLKYIDKNLSKFNLDRKERRGFWKEFYNNGKIRKEVFKQLEKELDNIKKEEKI